MLARFRRQLAVEPGQLSRPFGLRSIFPRAKIDAKCTEFCRAGLVRCARIDVSAPGDLKSYKSGDCDRSL